MAKGKPPKIPSGPLDNISASAVSSARLVAHEGFGCCKVVTEYDFAPVPKSSVGR